MKCDQCSKEERCKDGIDLEELKIDHYLWGNILHELEENGVEINDFRPNPEFCNSKTRKEEMKERYKELRKRKEKLMHKRKKIKHYVEETRLPDTIAKLLKREEIKDVKRYMRKVNSKLDEYEKIAFK